MVGLKAPVLPGSEFAILLEVDVVALECSVSITEGFRFLLSSRFLAAWRWLFVISMPDYIKFVVD